MTARVAASIAKCAKNEEAEDFRYALNLVGTYTHTNQSTGSPVSRVRANSDAAPASNVSKHSNSH